MTYLINWLIERALENHITHLMFTLEEKYSVFCELIFLIFCLFFISYKPLYSPFHWFSIIFFRMKKVKIWPGYSKFKVYLTKKTSCIKQIFFNSTIIVFKTLFFPPFIIFFINDGVDLLLLEMLSYNLIYI